MRWLYVIIPIYIYEVFWTAFGLLGFILGCMKKIDKARTYSSNKFVRFFQFNRDASWFFHLVLVGTAIHFLLFFPLDLFALFLADFADGSPLGLVSSWTEAFIPFFVIWFFFVIRFFVLDVWAIKRGIWIN